MDPVFDDADSLLEATRFLASIGDKQSFNPLPPVFLNDSPTVSSQQLWANASLPGYQAGPVSAESLPGGELLGAAILSIESHSCPVLLFVDHTAKHITSVVYEAKLAYLEAQLYNFRKQPSALEIKWKGDTFSASHLQLFEMMGEYLKSIGKSFVPACLLTNDLHGYHLERTGPVPYLHMRTVANEDELETVKALILAHISACRAVDATYTPSVYDWSGHADTTLDTTLGYYTFQTLFTKASGTTTDTTTGTDTGTDTGTTPPPSPGDLAQQIAHVPALAVVMELMINAGPANDAIRESMKKAIADAATAPSGTSGTSGPGTTCAAADAPARATISDLMNLSSRLYSVRNIGHSGGISQAYCLASYMFEPSDVATAIREITNEPSSTRPIQSARELIKSLAKRVDIAYSVMCIELSSNRYVRSIRLINSETDCELDVDCAGRLLDCPWVFPVGLGVYNRESANFFTLQSTGLARDLLRVCPSLRQAYQLTAILEQPITKVQAEVDFTALDKRLDSLQKIVTEASAAASSNTVADLSRLQSANKQLKTIRDPHCNDADSISNCASKRVKGGDASAANSASK